MTRLVLGIHSTPVGASAAIVDERGLCAAIAEERFTRRARSGGFPRSAVAEVLRLAGARADDLTDVALAGDPMANLASRVAHAARHPAVSAPRAWQRLGRREPSPAELVADAAGARRARVRPRVHRVEHHLAHIAGAFYTSPFERAAGFSADAAGDFATCMTAAGAGTRVEVRRRVLWPHSLGVLYTAVCQFAGFGRRGDEDEVMALAAHGVNGFAPEMRELARLDPERGLSLDLQYFRHQRVAEALTEHDDAEVRVPQLWDEPMITLFGPPRRPGAAVTDRERDLAASLQSHFEALYLGAIERAVAEVGSRDVALAGASTRNAPGNGRMITERVADRAYFHPAPSGDGTAAGAALWVYHGVHGGPRAAPLRHAYLGSAWSDAEIEQALVEAALPFSRLRREPLVARAAEALAAGRIVGWFQGREEWGPCALGNRSVLCHPGWPGIKARLAACVGPTGPRATGQPVRAYGSAVRAERLSTCFHGAHESPFMSVTYRVRPAWRERLSAVTCEDGTGRVQTVRREDNALFFDLLAEVEARTGIPALLNTSFGEGEPLVHTPAEAIERFARTAMDALGIGSFWLERPGSRDGESPPGPPARG
jgi:carbamoyltransferase